MIGLKVNANRLAISMLLLITIGITSGCAAKISKEEKSIETFMLQNIAIKKLTAIKKMNVVVVRKNELLLVSLNDSDKNITLDSGGIFSRPLISTSKNLVSYLKNNVLSITTDNLKHIKVADNVPQLSFSWQDRNSLLYSPISGGLYVYDVVNKISKPLPPE